MQSVKFRFGPFELDANRFELRRDGELVPLQRRAFDLLLHLVEKRDVVVTKEDLLAHVWSGVAVTKDSLAQAVMSVRTALADDVDRPAYIQTIRGRGYRFVATVEEVERESVPEAHPPPHPTNPTSPATTRLVGRDREIALLREKLARASTGKGGIVLVSGETGTGKTTLLDELCTTATNAKAIMVRCFSGEGAPDLWPFAQVLRDLRRPSAHLLEPLELQELEQNLDSPTTRFRIFEQVVSTIISSASASAPLLVAIDDLQLADAHSLGLLELLSSQLRSAPLLVVAAYGTTTPRHSGFSATIAAVSREATAGAIRLEPFDFASAARFVEVATGKTPSPELVAKLMEKTKGNPLFLSQLVPVLRAEERLRANEMATSILVGGEGMRDAITQHLAALPASTERVLSVASVFGRSFRVAPLAATLATTNDALLRELDAAGATKIIKADGPLYRFTVPLVRDVLYRKLPAGERARLHAAAARALEDHLGSTSDHERVAEIASHLVDAAAGGDVDRAVDFSVRAAELALAAGAPEAAARYAARGLDAFRFAQKIDETQKRRLTAFTK